MEFDDKDRAILRALQRDASLTLQDLAGVLAMSQATVWRRVQELERAGVIVGRVALVDAAAVDLGVCVITNITLRDHSQEATEAFERFVAARQEIMACYTISGSYDYLLKVRVRDVEAYERFLTRHLLPNPVIASVASSFTLRQLKDTTVLPL